MTNPARWPASLIAILIIGALLRLATLAVPSVHHPDEIYQYLEAAHRLLFGYGVVPWEYRVGMRSWLFPMLLAGPMQAGDWIAPGTGLYLLLPRIAMVLASSTIILSAWMLGARVSQRHANAAALVTAIWYELIAFSGHALGESAGLAAAAGAAALMFGTVSSPRRLVAAGALLALAGVLRFQAGPALVVLAVFAGGSDWRGRWAPMVAGGVAMLLASSLIDLAHGGVPFGWLVENVRQNILFNKAASFGEAPATAYIGVVGNMWRWGSVPIVIAAYIGMRRQPALFWAAAVHIAVHSLIGHKEYRFILLTDAFAIILAAIGTVDLIDAARSRLGDRWRHALAATAAICWIGGSAMLAALPWNRPLWTARATAMQSFAGLRSDPALCGIGILGLPVSEFGGYVGLHRNVPIYLFDTAYPHQAAMAASHAAAYDYAVTTSMRAPDVPAGYQLIGCRSTAGEYVGNYTNPGDAGSMSAVCVFRRPGGCDSVTRQQAAEFAINRALAAMGR